MSTNIEFVLNYLLKEVEATFSALDGCFVNADSGERGNVLNSVLSANVGMSIPEIFSLFIMGSTMEIEKLKGTNCEEESLNLILQGAKKILQILDKEKQVLEISSNYPTFREKLHDFVKGVLLELRKCSTSK